MKKYPRLSNTEKKPKNTLAVCDWCDEIGKYKLTIENDHMRGNDDVVWACEEHKRGGRND